MLYDLSNPMQAKQARAKFEKMEDRGAVIELTEKKGRRTLPQNAYLHLCLSYLASQLGERLEYVKMNYYKLACNRQLFVAERYDKVLRENTRYIRSSAELTTQEMSESIDRLKEWAATVPADPVVLPDAENPREIAAAQLEVERYKQFLF